MVPHQRVRGENDHKRFAQIAHSADKALQGADQSGAALHIQQHDGHQQGCHERVLAQICQAGLVVLARLLQHLQRLVPQVRLHLILVQLRRASQRNVHIQTHLLLMHLMRTLHLLHIREREGFRVGQRVSQDGFDYEDACGKSGGDGHANEDASKSDRLLRLVAVGDGLLFLQSTCFLFADKQSLSDRLGVNHGPQPVVAPDVVLLTEQPRVARALRLLWRLEPLPLAIPVRHAFNAPIHPRLLVLVVTGCRRSALSAQDVVDALLTAQKLVNTLFEKVFALQVVVARIVPILLAVPTIPVCRCAGNALSPPPHRHQTCDAAFAG
mmetsp:Transcript_9972/g.17975  ORF Transcript_9972/g.17975 Transcript_9972/m.17975 type:complete len:325 (-) Transcript_9972:119-1093(-)